MFSEEEVVESWLAKYINRNDEVDDTFHQSSMEMREFENELFEIKTRHEIIVAPLREHIEEWLRKSLIKITEPENQEAVVEVTPPQPQQKYTKGEP